MNNTVSQFAVLKRLSREKYWTRRNVTQSKTQICLICPKELLAVLASIIVFLLYDIMQNCEQLSQDGLLLLVDFEKAFDSVSWSFLYKTFEFFNFGPSILSWIKLFNNNVTAYISQCGFLSDKIPIKRGCRQGDPIASYEFLICAEILSKMLTSNKNIKGISIGENEYLVSQFADDTTILLDGTSS